jgi:hypothetical protein
MTRLDIYTKSGIRLDLQAGTKVNFNFQLNNFNEVTNRQCTYTNTFTIPATDKNKGVLRALGRIQVILQNGSDYFLGYLIVRKELADNKGFECNFYTDLFNFSEAIKAKKINELDFSEYDFLWSTDNLGASPNLSTYFDATEGVVTLIDYENIVDNTTITYKNGAGVFGTVGIYFKDVMQKVFDSIGWTYTGAVLNSDLYNALVMPLMSRTGIEPEQLYVDVASEKTHFYQNSILSIINENITNIFTNEISDIYNRFDTTNGYQTNIGGNYKFYIEIECNLSHSNTFTSTAVNFVFKNNGVTFATLNSMSSYENGKYKHTYFYNEALPNGANNKITVHAVTDNFTLPLYIYSAKFNITVSELATNFLPYDTQYLINSNLPSIAYADMLKIFYQLFFVIPIVDAQNKSIEFIQFDEIYNSRETATDISELIDYKTISKTNLSTYAQKNYARYQKTEIMPFDLNRFRTIDNDALPPEMDFLNIKMPCTDNYGVLLHDFSLCRLDFTNSDFRLICVLPVDDASKPVTLKVDGGIDYNITKYHTTYFSPVPQVAHSLGFDYILNRYYNNFFIVLNNYEVLNLQMLLKDVNVNNIDLKKLFYIKDKGGYYYINKISGFTDRENLTNVELIKMI